VKAIAFAIEDDAVERICTVMASERMRAELRAHLRRQTEKFSAEKFMEGIRVAVSDNLGGYDRSSVDTPARREIRA
jgi:hypothetical protein